MSDVPPPFESADDRSLFWRLVDSKAKAKARAKLDAKINAQGKPKRKRKRRRNRQGKRGLLAKPDPKTLQLPKTKDRPVLPKPQPRKRRPKPVPVPLLAEPKDDVLYALYRSFEDNAEIWEFGPIDGDHPGERYLVTVEGGMEIVYHTASFRLRSDDPWRPAVFLMHHAIEETCGVNRFGDWSGILVDFEPAMA